MVLLHGILIVLVITHHKSLFMNTQKSALYFESFTLVWFWSVEQCETVRAVGQKNIIRNISLLGTF